MIETVNQYHNLGFSVIPIGENKQPAVKWKAHQVSLIEPNVNYFSGNNPSGIGIVCGKVSGGFEIIDIDTKYDLIGTIYAEYKAAINKLNPSLLKKLVVESTPSGGYHFMYRCQVVEGNMKLANRPTLESERNETYIKQIELGKSEHDAREAEKGDKVRVLLETRGEGGYVQVAPTKGYSLIYGEFSKVQEITVEERQTLLDCARSFNQYFEPAPIKREQQKIVSANENPFESFNESGDILTLLESHGWEIRGKKGGSKTYLLRPGGTQDKSAEWDESKRCFYVFTTSSAFEGSKGYNASQVLAKLKFNDDYKETVKWLVDNGYGNHAPKDTTNYTYTPKQISAAPISKINIDADDFSFLATIDEADKFIEQKRNGTFKQGAKTGIPEFDRFWRFKEGEFDMILGHDNVGKSTVSWYFALLDALFNDYHYVIFAGENKVGSVKLKLMEFYLCRKIEAISDQEFADAKKWVESKFDFIRNDESYNYMDIINMGTAMLKRKPKIKMIAEPYNILERDSNGNDHQFDQKAMNALRLFIRKTGIGLTLNVHASTEALRRTYPKEHEWFGYPQPPNKADAEGGGKFTGRADNFMVIHRMTNHPTEWIWTEVHVQKLKEYETGGQITPKTEPFKIRLCQNGTGFETVSGYNAILEYWKSKQSLPPSLKPNLEAFELERKPISEPRVNPKEILESDIVPF